MKKTTISDVAKLAKVSVATVSRILNNVDYPISESKKKAVLKAINDLEYVPSMSAQNLKSQKSKLIGLIVRDIADPYFAEIAKGVTETAIQYGYLALVCNSKRNVEYELSYYDTLRQHNVKGIIIAGSGSLEKEVQEHLIERIQKSNSTNIKTIALAPQGFDMPCIGVDNFRIGKMIGQYLIDKKHTKIAYVGGDENIIVNKLRFEGFMDSMDQNNVQIPSALIVHDEFTWEGGFRSAEKLLEMKQEITAICCANDNIAIGVIRLLNENGLDVPNDISVIGVGDINLAEYTSPKLTTIKIPFYELGKQSVDMICGNDTSLGMNHHFASEIMERGTVKELV